MSRHDRFRSLVVSSLDSGLSASERTTLNEHLAGCAECRGFADAIRADATLLGAVATPDASAEGTSPVVRERVLAAAAATRSSQPTRRMLMQYALLAILAALILVIAGVLYAGAQPRLRAEQATPSLVSIAAAAVTATIDTSGRLPPEPQSCLIGFGHHSTPDCRIGLAAGDGSLWVDAGRGVVRVDPGTDTISEAIPLESDPRDLVFMDGSLFVATEAGGIARIDPAANAVTSTIDVAAHPLAAMASSPDGQLWVTVPSAGEVVRVDPAKASVIARVAVGGEPFDVGIAGDSAWVTDRVNNLVTRIDVAANRTAGVIKMPGFAPRDIEVTSAGAWVIGESEVALLDPATGTIVRQVPGPALADIGSGVSGVWAMTAVNSRLQLLIATDGSETAPVDIDPTALTDNLDTAVTESLGSVWVVRYGSPALVRVDVP